jgi:hypothetical protein
MHDARAEEVLSVTADWPSGKAQLQVDVDVPEQLVPVLSVFAYVTERRGDSLQAGDFATIEHVTLSDAISSATTLRRV